jgi:crotonobetainyl-CoA:carnitine CoA-transferase CaiB-like acyl-CoA transferase
MCGLMSVTGEADGAPGGGPMKVGPSIVDVITGLFASSAIQAALYCRDVQGGDGQYIDLALLDCGIAAMSHHAMQYLISGIPPARRGTAGNGGAPSGRFRCADGDIMLSPGNDEQFRRLVTVLGCPALATDSRFLSNPMRVANRDEITPLVASEVGKWHVEALVAALSAEGVPAASINNLAQVFDDAQVRHRQMAVSGAHALAGALPMIANPIRFSETPISRYAGPPVLGEHTDQILSALLSFDEAGIAALRHAGAI